jgi:hypothetical protein
MQLFESGVNPRTVLRHKERGKVDFGYHYAELAEATGLKASTLASFPPLGRACRARNLSEVFAWALPKFIKRRSVPLQPKEWLDDHYIADWLRRWPLLDAYRCAVWNCKRIGLGVPLCGYHGVHGGWRLMKYFELWTGAKYVPLHRFLTPTDDDHIAYLIDGNPWNNRLDNVKVCTHDQFAEIVKERFTSSCTRTTEGKAP